MFSVKTLDSFQVIPIPVSKENLSAVYKLKKKSGVFFILYYPHVSVQVTQVYVEPVAQHSQKVKIATTTWVYTVRPTLSRSRSHCIPPMHSYFIVAKSLPSRPPFFAWIWVGNPLWWEAPESDTFTISIVFTSFSFRTILVPQQSEQPRPVSYCFCCGCSTIPYRRIWRYIVNIDETLVSKATLKSDCIWGD